MSAGEIAPAEARRDAAIGYAAAGVAVTIWAAWIVWTRQSVAAGYGAPLGPIDVALLRFGAPALLLAPVWLRPGLLRGLKPPQTSWPVLVAMLGWGAPFALMAAEGLKTTSVAHMAALTPGAMPLFAAAAAWALFSERLSGGRRLGLALIGVAVALTVGPTALAGEWAALSGAPWLLAAAASWAAFAIGFRRSGLGPVRAAGVVAAYSTIALLVLAAIFGTRLFELSWGELAWQALTHGVISGALSITLYAVAIDKLGGARATALSALVPVLAALIGVAILGEALGPLEWLALLSASVGVALVNDALGAWRARRSRA